MIIEFKKKYKAGNVEYPVGAVLNDRDSEIWMEQLPSIVILIKNGLRYDIPVDIISIIEN